MIKRVPFKTRTCAACKEPYPASEYAITNSIFFPDNHLSICNHCLDKMCLELKGEWAFVDSVCRWADVAFIPEKWTAIWSTSPQNALSNYLKLFQRSEYNRIHWDTYQDRWLEAIKNNKEKELHPLFDQEAMDKMRAEWGTSYSQEELYRLTKLYDGVKKSFGISNPLAEQDGRQLCKLSIAIDQCIEDGANGVDKLVNSYNKLKEGGGFVAENATDNNNFDSISELVQYMEETGWNVKFQNDEPRDIVDSTIKNIQNYNSRLYKNEASVSDQIDERLEQMRRVSSLENMNFEDDELDKFDNDGYAPDDEQTFEVEI